MKIYSVKKRNIPKVAVLGVGLAVAAMVITVQSTTASAHVGYTQDCTGCHGSGGSITATPSTATPAAGANYTVALSPAPRGYWITGTGVSLTGSASSVTVKAPAAAGVYTYNVYVRASSGAKTTYKITVGPVTPPPTTIPPTTIPPTTPPTTTPAPVGAPTANFTATFPTGVAPVVVGLTGSATNSPTSWAWNFGNGTTSAAQNPWTSYATAGTYTVTLTARNASGASAPVTKTITVTTTTAPPATSAAIISSLSPNNGQSGDRITISGSGFGQAGVVKFGTVTASVSSWSATRISVTVPREGSNSRVSVTVTPANGTASNARTFDYGGSDD